MLATLGTTLDGNARTIYGILLYPVNPANRTMFPALVPNSLFWKRGSIFRNRVGTPVLFFRLEWNMAPLQG